MFDYAFLDRNTARAVKVVRLLGLNIDPEAYRPFLWFHGQLPHVPIASVFPNIDKTNITIHRAFDRTLDTSLDATELLQICAIERYIGAKNILEIGTFDGNTALNLAANASEGGCVTTVDLPPQWDSTLSYTVPRGYRNITNLNKVGEQYKNTTYESMIHQVLCDSVKLDWRKLGSPFDLVFIDGCHYYDYVKTDTTNSLLHLKPRGIIVWHDYGMFQDVSKVVDEIAKTMPVYALRGGRLAVGVRKTITPDT